LNWQVYQKEHFSTNIPEGTQKLSINWLATYIVWCFLWWLTRLARQMPRRYC